MLIVSFLKLVIFLLRTFTRNSGTALPGLWLERYFPQTLKKLLNQLETVTLITGTNGKTTTSRMFGQLLDQNKISYISNISGSNLIRGIASTLIQNAGYNGKLRAKTAIFEVEEATMPKLTKLLTPKTIIVTNIFRDQLDAYGEIDKTYQYIKESIELSKNPHLILNLDDERVRKLADFTTNTIDFISLHEEYLQHIKTENKNLENNVLHRGRVYKISHIGDSDTSGTHFQIETNNALLNNTIHLPGIHNTLNALSAQLAFAALLKTELVDLREEQKYDTDLSYFQPAFGRGEKLLLNNTEFEVLLVKNPAGMNLNLQYLSKKPEVEAILFLLNDNIADGRDVSWIWDCNFDLLKETKVGSIYVGGDRKYDMALRIKYSGLICQSANLPVGQADHIETGLGETEGQLANSHTGKLIFDTLYEAIQTLQSSGFKKVYVLPTYTAMLQFREEFSKVGEVKEIWK
jgi:UDP-N-acetylmuramyl tripeptide synthase